MQRTSGLKTSLAFAAIAAMAIGCGGDDDPNPGADRDVEDHFDADASDDPGSGDDPGDSDDPGLHDEPNDTNGDQDTQTEPACNLESDDCAAPMTALWTADGEVHGFARGDDGTFYAAGAFRSLSPPAEFSGMVSLDLDDGVPNPVWPSVSGTVAVLVPDGSGGVYLGGTFTHVGGVPRGNLAHLDATGALSDWSPSVDGRPAAGSLRDVESIAIRNGVVYVAGAFRAANGEPRHGFAAFDSDGALLALNPYEGTSIFNGIREVFTADDMLIVTGTFNEMDGEDRTSVAAFDLDHELLPFAPVLTGPFSSVTIDSSAYHGGVLYLGGSFEAVNGELREGLGAVRLNGEAHPWNPPEVIGSVDALLPTEDRIYVAGALRLGSDSRTTNTPRVFTFSNDAESELLDWEPRFSTFISHGFPTGGEVHDLVETPEGIVVVGRFEYVYSSEDVRANGSVGTLPTRRNIALIGHDGQLSSWSPDTQGTMFAVAMVNERCIAGGNFEFSDTASRAGLAAFQRDGTITDFNADAGGSLDNASTPSIWGLAWREGALYVAGDFARIGGQTRPGLAALTPAGEATAWNPEPARSRGLRAIALGGERVYTALLGQRSTDGIRSVQSFDTATGEQGWGLAGHGARTLLATNNRLFVAGSFTHIAGEDREDFAAFDLDGQITDWSIDFEESYADGNPRIHTLSRVGETLYLAGRFTGINGESRPGLAALDNAGALTPLAADWTHGRVDWMATGGGWIFLGSRSRALFEDDDGHEHFLVAMRPDGTIVPFAPQARFVTGLYWADGFLFAGGRFERESDGPFDGWVHFALQ